MNASKHNHAFNAAEFIKDDARTNWHDETLWFVRHKRDLAATTIPEWEALREAASNIKEHTLSNLDIYLAQFESNALKNGVKVHWAANAEEHNKIVHAIIKSSNSKKIVKSKSMLTEECHLNSYLAKNGIEVVDTDLGERIVQFRDEVPSHIVLPAIHLKKEDVSDTFHEHLGTEKNNTNPEYLTHAARAHLRNKFIESTVAITGVNFAIAETGGIVVCTNEGNADMGVHSAGIHIACMGIEKIIPAQKHLSVFTRLLARSATGQAITTYTSHFHKPQANKQMHIVLLDNGRSTQLGRAEFSNSLKCIRCGACSNTCPIFRRSGGHSYHTAVAGPIGSILAPNMDLKQFSDLPFASTLCGSCSNVCPVKINIHEQLWAWRQEIVKANHVEGYKKIMINTMSFVLSNPKLYRFSGKVARFFLRRTPFLFQIKVLNPWYKNRELPKVPKMSFNEWYQKNK